MTDIIKILYMIIYLYSANPASYDPVMAQNVFAEYQLNGMEAAVDKLEEYSPVNSAAVEVIPEVPDEIKLDPAKLDYKKELITLGFYREDSKDSKLNLRNAVLRFQSSCNMTVNGNWDKKCLTALTGILTAQDMPVKDSIASPPSEGMWIAINKSKRILTLYEGMNILKKYPIAIGNPSTLTPDGKFTIVSKVIDPDWGGGGYTDPVKGGVPENPLGHRWMGLSYKSGDDLGIHGNNSPYSIGKNISHGCIRMINSDVEELFEIIPKSSKVWLGTDAVLKSWGIEQLGL
jgi:hypothetical protein